MIAPLFKVPRLHSACFRVVDMVLRNDPTLHAVVKTWRSYVGDPSDGDEITGSLCPFVRLTPQAPAATQATEKTYNSDLQIRIDVATAGTRVDDGMDLWDAVMAALWPGDNSVKDLLDSALPGRRGAYAYWLMNAAFGVEAVTDGPVIVCSGTLRIGILAPS